MKLTVYKGVTVNVDENGRFTATLSNGKLVDAGSLDILKRKIRIGDDAKYKALKGRIVMWPFMGAQVFCHWGELTGNASWDSSAKGVSMEVVNRGIRTGTSWMPINSLRLCSEAQVKEFHAVAEKNRGIWREMNSFVNEMKRLEDEV